MKILSYQVKRFCWATHSQTLDDADPEASGEIQEGAVFWLHIEESDEADDARIFKKTLKHIKWIANNKSLKSIVLHSFAHLGGQTATASYARHFLNRMSERLKNTGYSVHQTPFGWFCSWDISVYGDSMAKVFRSFESRTDSKS